MLLTIIPFVLAARFALDENYQERYRWRYGSESVYDVSVNLSQTDLGEESRSTTFCSTISGELECRPKDSESLGCRFLNGMISSWRADDSSGCQQSRNVPTTRDDFFDHEPFEIRFNSDGIENLVVRRTIPRWRLDVIKAVVAQLDIGSELDKEPSWFVRMENSTFGSCELELKILATGDRENENESENEFEIVSLNSNGSRFEDVLSRGGNIIIEKIRRPEKCPGRAIYFFGHASNDERTERGTFLDMVSSVTRTTISKRRFSSRTFSEGAVVTLDGSTISRSHQSITLSLKRVKPAGGIPPKISSPASTGLYAPSSLAQYLDAARRVLHARRRRKLFPMDQQPLPIFRTATKRTSRTI